MKFHLASALILSFALPLIAQAKVTEKDYQEYRSFTNRIRKKATFKIPMPGGGDQIYKYELELGEPIYDKPKVGEYPTDDALNGGRKLVYRSFWDRIWLKDGSYALIGGEKVPLTCIFVSAQDNRMSGTPNPRFPEFIMRIYLVANDYTCTGPLNPSWPSNGGKKEMWDTYIHYEVRDPTIMLPTEPKIRYRWNEWLAVWVE